jgi:hypothetical protein
MVRFLLCLYLSSIAIHSYATDQGIKRFALVINNKNYATAPLINSGNDVIVIADSLNTMGFRVEILQEPFLKAKDLQAKYDNEILTLVAEDNLNGALTQLFMSK